jgi:hypothetical protein
MKGITMHKLLTDIFQEYPGKMVSLSLGKFPRVEFDGGSMEVTTGSDGPLTPERMAEVVNSLITDDEGAALKRDHAVKTRMTDELYQRYIDISYSVKGFSILITSELLRDIEIENKKIIDAATTLELIKG